MSFRPKMGVVVHKAAMRAVLASNYPFFGLVELIFDQINLTLQIRHSFLLLTNLLTNTP
jgi:hypothetical protein